MNASFTNQRFSWSGLGHTFTVAYHHFGQHVNIPGKYFEVPGFRFTGHRRFRRRVGYITERKYRNEK